MISRVVVAHVACIRARWRRDHAKSHAVIPPCMALANDLSSCRALHNILIQRTLGLNFMPFGSWANGIKLNSDILLYQGFMCFSAWSGSPQASLGPRVTAWGSIHGDRVIRRLPRARIPLTMDQNMAFASLHAIRPRALSFTIGETQYISIHMTQPVAGRCDA